MKLGIILVLIAIAGVVVFGFMVLGKKDNQITLGLLDDSLLGSLILVAQDQGFFEKENISVKISKYNSGNEALAEMTADKINLTAIPLITAVQYDFKDKNSCILASLASSTNFGRIVARKDSGIGSPLDLRGKKIATEKGTASHLFLTAFLSKYHFGEDDVNVVFENINDMPKLLVDGAIDAFSARVLVVRKASAFSNDKVIKFSEPGLVETRLILIASKNLTDNNPENIGKFLKALVAAEDFIKTYPQQTSSIVAREFDVDQSLIYDLWQYNNFNVALDRGLLDLMASQIQWAKQTKLIAQDRATDYKDTICAGSLSKIKPQAVNIY